MTKKDYEILAKAIKRARYASGEQENHVVTRVAEEIATELASDNPRFNRERFIEATY